MSKRKKTLASPLIDYRKITPTRSKVTVTIPGIWLSLGFYAILFLVGVVGLYFFAQRNPENSTYPLLLASVMAALVLSFIITLTVGLIRIRQRKAVNDLLEQHRGLRRKIDEDTERVLRERKSQST